MFRKTLGKSNNVEKDNHNTELAWDHIVKGVKRNQLQQFDQAVQEFTLAISLDNNCAHAYANRASSLHMKGQIRCALMDIHTAITMNRSDTMWYGLRALLRLYTDNLIGVIDDCYVALQSKNAGVEWRCVTLGLQMWAKQQNNDDSWIAHLDTYVKLVTERAKSNPALLEAAPLALIMREIGIEGVSMSFAYGAMRQKKYTEAVKNFTNALDINQNNSFALLNRGVANLMQRNLTSGLQDFNKAIAVDAGFADPFYFRGIGYSLVGDHVKAKTDFTHYAQLGGDHSLVTDENIRKMVSQFKN